MASRDWKIVRLLTIASLKMLLRDRRIVSLLVVSALAVLGGLLFVFQLSRHQVRVYGSPEPYKKLAFDFSCHYTNASAQSNVFTSSNIECVPVTENTWSLLSSIDLLSQPEAGHGSSQLISYLSSLMMNGIPLVDLDDYVRLSDLANRYLGSLRPRLMASSFLWDQFSNLMDVRQKRIVLSPPSCLSTAFRDFLKEGERVRDLEIDIMPTKALASAFSDDKVWAVVEISLPASLPAAVCPWNATSSSSVAEVEELGFTIRMPPSSVPDTRNYEWSPLKRALVPQQSGHLLYLLSGFLPLQLEIEAFLQTSYAPSSSQTRRESVLSEVDDKIFPLGGGLFEIARGLLTAKNESELPRYLNSSALQTLRARPPLHFPLYHRALPAQGYAQKTFFKVFEVVIIVALALLFALPASLTMASHLRLCLAGHRDVLLTLPGVQATHLLAAWCTSSHFLTLVQGVAAYLVFLSPVLTHSPSWLPTLSLVLGGVGLVPVGALAGLVTRSADSLVLAIPGLAFLLLLPALLYSTLAYDISRTMAFESMLCIISPLSAPALLLGLISRAEGVGWGLDLEIWGSDSLRVDRLGTKGFWATGTRLPLWAGCSKEENLEVLGQELRTDLGPVAVSLRGLTKTYYATSSSVSSRSSTIVLDQISANLLYERITIVLGGNGAGKTTLMRLLAGLDRSYEGFLLRYPSNERLSRQREVGRRYLGWCPQEEALYGLLTVEEHLDLFRDILSLSKQAHGSEEGGSVHELDKELISLLGLTACSAQPAQSLSGGQKRRLSLALALCGAPALLLLDEPTSGCDAASREIVRIALLRAQSLLGCAIALSTHHVDDIEVLAQRIWFLNDRALDLDADASHLLSTALKQHGAGMVFQSADPEVWRLYEQWKAEQRLPSELPAEESPRQRKDDNGLHTVHIPVEREEQEEALGELVSRLERRGLHSFNLQHPTLYSTLAALYTSPHTLPPTSTTTSAPSALREDLKDSLAWFSTNVFLRHVQAMLYLRCLDVWGSRPGQNSGRRVLQYLVFHLFLPAVLGLSLAYYCSDLLYPCITLSSHGLTHGLGSVLVTTGSSVQPRHLGGALRSIGDIEDAVNRSAILRNLPFLFAKEPATSEEVMVAFSTTDSSSSSSSVSPLYYPPGLDALHKDGPHYGSVVVADELVDFLETSLSLPATSDSAPPYLLIPYLHHLQSEVCTSSSSSYLPPQGEAAPTAPTSSPTHKSKRSGGRRSGRKSSEHNREYDIIEGYRLESAIAFCPPRPHLLLQLFRKKTSSHDVSTQSNSSNGAPYLWVVRSYRSAVADLTLLTNITVDHAPPIFLREVVHPLATILFPSAPGRNTVNNGTQASFVGDVSSWQAEEAVASHPSYRLQSHPLSFAGHADRPRLERGYLGSLLLLLLYLLASTPVVRALVTYRVEGIDRLLYLAGLSPGAHLLANYLFDCLVYLALPCLFLTFTFGTSKLVRVSPLYAFFFPAGAMTSWWRLVGAYLLAVVSGHYLCATVVAPDEVLSAQLIALLTAVLPSLVLKLFLQRLAGGGGRIYAIVDWLARRCSAVYAFVCGAFALFAIYPASLLPLPVHRRDSGHSSSPQEAEIETIITILLVQACAYLLATFLLVYFEAPLKQCYHRMRYYYSARNLTSSLAPLIPGHLGKDDEGLLAVGRQLLTDYSVGIFPRLPSFRRQGCEDTLSVESGEERIPLISPSASIATYSSSSSSSISSSAFTAPPAACDEEVLRAKNLTVVYSHSGQSRLSLVGVDLLLRRGRRLALLGSNGGGKSTFFRAATGSQVPCAGSLCLDGLDSVAGRWLLGPRGSVGYVPQEQEGGLPEFLTPRQVFLLFAALRLSPTLLVDEEHGEGLPRETLSPCAPRHCLGGEGVEEEETTVEGVLPVRFLDYPLSALSGGTRKKVHLLCASLGRPALLLLDECTTGVDPIASETIMRYLAADLRRVNTTESRAANQREQGVLLTSHRLEDCLTLCDEVVLLCEGEVAMQTSVSAFQTLATQYFQVDITISETESLNEVLDRLLELIHKEDDGGEGWERAVRYSPLLARLTCHRGHTPFSAMYASLQLLRKQGVIRRFSVRAMEMEEVLAALLATLASEQSSRRGCSPLVKDF
eukprot:gene11157-12437_t